MLARAGELTETDHVDGGVGGELEPVVHLKDLHSSTRRSHTKKQHAECSYAVSECIRRSLTQYSDAVSECFVVDAYTV
jgi:hypothetical protein